MAGQKLPRAWQKLKTAERRRRGALRKARSLAIAKVTVAPPESAKAAGLRDVCADRTPGIRRIGRHRRVHYVDARGRRISNRAELRRITALVIPPAWTDVWICPDASGHLQATGRDARGRKQYRYHPRWRDVRDELKFGKLIAFARALPRLHQQTAADLRRPGLPRQKVIAAVVGLLEKTLIRVGNDEYARDNGSIGLTTMRDRHARVNGSKVRFAFQGKSRVHHAVDLDDARLRAVEVVAQRLGNTKSVCRKSYIHPAVIDAYLDGAAIEAGESGVVAIIRRHLRAA